MTAREQASAFAFVVTPQAKEKPRASACPPLFAVKVMASVLAQRVSAP
jgi:hypothetical protein